MAGAASVTLEDAEDSPLLEPAPGETPLWPTVVVTGLFDSEILQDLTRLQESAVWKSRRGFHLSRVPDRAWEREWLKHFRPRGVIRRAGYWAGRLLDRLAGDAEEEPSVRRAIDPEWDLGDRLRDVLNPRLNR